MPDTAERNTIKKSRGPVTIALAVLLGAAAATGLYFLAVVDPENSRLLPPCLFYRFTGLYCAGCGVSRALHDILNGHVWAGFRMNPLAVAALPFLIGWLAAATVRHLRGKPLPRLPSWLPWVAIAVIVLFTVARNLPWEPFSWLAPTSIGG